MSEDAREDMEEYVLQALGHKERRDILRIIGARPEGVLYSDILNELGMNTGKLNYQLKLIESLTEKTDDRKYRLSPLGKRALQTLNSLSDDVDEDTLLHFSNVSKTQNKFLTSVVNLWGNIILFGLWSAAAGVGVIMYLLLKSSEAPSFSYIVLMFPLVMQVWFYRRVKKMKQETPEKIIGFMQWFKVGKE